MLCTVVIYPFSMPQCSSSTLTNGAKLFVVHEPLDHRVARRFMAASLTPDTAVGTSLSGDGAEISTWRAPALKCAAAFSAEVNFPVDSMTTWTPSAFQGRFSGEGSLNTRMT